MGGRYTGRYTGYSVYLGLGLEKTKINPGAVHLSKSSFLLQSNLAIQDIQKQAFMEFIPL